MLILDGEADIGVGDRRIERYHRAKRLLGFVDAIEEAAFDAEFKLEIGVVGIARERRLDRRHRLVLRSEEHTSELQSLMRISYAVFCLNKKIRQIVTII